jgi:hypothetical protein
MVDIALKRFLSALDWSRSGPCRHDSGKQEVRPRGSLVESHMHRRSLHFATRVRLLQGVETLGASRCAKWVPWNFLMQSQHG